MKVTFVSFAANPNDHILWAAENGDVNVLKEILRSQPGLVHAQDSDGYTPLHRAAYGNHLAAICYLLSAGAKVTTKTHMGWTPLHSACNWNNYKVAARLLAAGADPAALSDGGWLIHKQDQDGSILKVEILNKLKDCFLIYRSDPYAPSISYLTQQINIACFVSKRRYCTSSAKEEQLW